jgi:hypothetical protein
VRRRASGDASFGVSRRSRREEVDICEGGAPMRPYTKPVVVTVTPSTMLTVKA